MKLILSLLLHLLLFVSAPLWAQQPDHRPSFKKQTILVGSKKIIVEVADTDPKREYGLMFVTTLPKDQGMLFIFDRPTPLSFWMKNTLIPLAIAYFDTSKKLIEVLEMEPASLVQRAPPSYPSSRPAQYALEMNKGWFKAHHVPKGALLKILP